MPTRLRLAAPLVCAVALFLAAGAATAHAAGQSRVVIRSARPFAAVESAVKGLGGAVLQRYENVDAIAATIPDERFADLVGLVGADKVYYDVLVQAPRPVEEAAHGQRIANASVAADAAEAVDAAALASTPADYAFNNALIGASTLHAAGNLGQDVIVAVIDTGTTNSPTVPALSLAGQVIGGEGFTPGDPVVSPTSRRNAPHGTWVGTVIAGNVGFRFANASAFVKALKLYAPGAIAGACPDPPTLASCVVPMLGVAPLAKLYAVKIFPSNGGGAPESQVIAAMDRVITLKHNFNQGLASAPVAGDGSEDNPFKYDSLNVQVVNMSLGGPTGFAGRDLEDELTAKMVKEGITIVASAGNDGFAAMTGGSPGSGFGALTVGAASDAAHERVVADLFLCGPGCGSHYRPTDGLQTVDFSSRGPTADGRFDPDITANGVWTWAQGTCQTSASCVAGTALAPLSFVSGTSFSSPTAAGAAALLRKAVPSADAAQLRNALIEGANPHLLVDSSKRIDQGRGFLDVPAALAKLQGGHVSRRIERSFPTPWVALNILPLGFHPILFRGDSYSAHVTDLEPGQVIQFFVPSDPWTDRLTFKFSNITPELPPDQQNTLFGDDVAIRIADAPTSTWFSPCADCGAFLNADRTIVVNNPQTGLVRLALQGDWTNVGKVSADIVIERERGRRPLPTAVGRIHQSEQIPVSVNVPPGTAQVVFELSWEGNWSRYPANDLDMVILDPDFPISSPNVDGATIASPERVVVDNPKAGLWTAYIQGFSIQSLWHEPRGNVDTYALRVTADGKPLSSVQ